MSTKGVQCRNCAHGMDRQSFQNLKDTFFVVNGDNIRGDANAFYMTIPDQPNQRLIKITWRVVPDDAAVDPEVAVVPEATVVDDGHDDHVTPNTFETRETLLKTILKVPLTLSSQNADNNLAILYKEHIQPIKDALSTVLYCTYHYGEYRPSNARSGEVNPPHSNSLARKGLVLATPAAKRHIHGTRMNRHTMTQSEKANAEWQYDAKDIQSDKLLRLPNDATDAEKANWHLNAGAALGGGGEKPDAVRPDQDTDQDTDQDPVPWLRWLPQNNDVMSSVLPPIPLHDFLYPSSVSVSDAQNVQNVQNVQNAYSDASNASNASNTSSSSHAENSQHSIFAEGKSVEIGAEVLVPVQETRAGMLKGGNGSNEVSAVVRAAVHSTLRTEEYAVQGEINRLQKSIETLIKKLCESNSSSCTQLKANKHEFIQTVHGVFCHDDASSNNDNSSQASSPAADHSPVACRTRSQKKKNGT